MATVLTYNDFRYGMVSEKMRRRVDLAVYQKSAALIENLVPMRTGGVRLRPGTVFEADLTEMKAERIIPFVISVREHYIVVLSSGRLYILGLDISGRYENQTGEGFVTEYTSSEIKEIQVAQNNDLMILVQRNHPPFALQKGAEGGWQAGTINLDASTDAYNYAYDEDGNENSIAFVGVLDREKEIDYIAGNLEVERNERGRFVKSCVFGRYSGVDDEPDCRN